MATLNALLRTLFDTLLAPLQEMSPLVALVPISILTAIFALLVLKHTSKQDRMAAVKDQMFAGIFEIRLFNDDPILIGKATGGILSSSLHYIWLATWPAMLIIMVPVLFVIAQLQFHYGFEGFEPGDTVLLEVELEPPSGQETFAVGSPKPAASLELPPGLAQETPAVWIPSQNQLAWRLRVEEPGRHELTVAVDGERATKSLVASVATLRRSPVRTNGSFWNQVLYPAEEALPPDSGLTSISIDYPGRTIPFLFIDWNWLILYLVLMLVFGFALAKPMKVTV